MNRGTSASAAVGAVEKVRPAKVAPLTISQRNELAKLDYLPDRSAATYLMVTIAQVQRYRVNRRKAGLPRRPQHSGKPCSNVRDNIVGMSGVTTDRAISEASDQLRFLVLRLFDRLAHQRGTTRHKVAQSCGMAA